MIKIFVYAADHKLAEQTVQRLKEAGAEHVEVLGSVKIPARPTKDNRYLFICETPAEKIAELMPQELEEAAYDSELSTWYETQLKILDAYSTHKKRSLIISTTRLQANPEALVEHINAQWQLQLTQPEDGQTHSDGKFTDNLLGYIVQNLIQKTPPLHQLADSQTHAMGCTKKIYSEAGAIDSYRRHLSEYRTIQELLKCSKHELQENKELSEREITKLTHERDTQTKKAHQVQEGSDLLLLQLHQIQEELEHYFTKYKEAERKNITVQQRFDDMKKHHPNFFLYDKAQLKPISDNSIAWEITGLESAEVSREIVRFETFIESSVLGIRFRRANKNDAKDVTLIRWPHVAHALATVDCIPVGKSDCKELRAGILREISSADWALVKLIPNIVKQESIEDVFDEKNTVIHKQAADRTLAILNQLPRTLRFDSIVLEKNQVNEDYEHLWFEINGLKFGEDYWPKFEIRLGAANLQAGLVTKHPKIEIPLINGKAKPFVSWFEESVDDYGPKWELRFDLEKNISDVAVWNKISNKDKLLILELLKTLDKTEQITLTEKTMGVGDLRNLRNKYNLSKCLELIAKSNAH